MNTLNNVGRAVVYGGILLLALSQSFAAKAADCQPEVYADVRLHIEPDGRVYLPASIGGREVYFLLSMGSGLPILLESAVKSLGLTPQRITGNGIFSSGITHFVKLDGLAVGDFRFTSRAAPISPQPDATGPKMLEGKLLAGSIGSTLFQHVDVELNLAERQLKLFKPFRCMNRSPVYWGADAAKLPLRFDAAGALVFTLELNGKLVEAGMLSGARDSTIDANVAREFFGFDENSADVKVVDSGDGSPRKVFHAMSLTGPGLRISDTTVQLRPGKCKLTGIAGMNGAIGYESCLNVVPFNLGIDLLSQMRIYISSERKTVFVTIVGNQPPAN